MIKTQAPTFTDYGLEFTRLYARDDTDLIVIHHTGNLTDDDLSAERIHYMHLQNGWSGIGYHYVIRKDGTIEQGRPMDAIGAHAYGENSHTVGIHVCGNFGLVSPTQAQVESLSYLVGWVAEYYGITPDYMHVVGHRDLMPTACPGDNLYNLLQTIRGKAIWYQQNY